MCEVAERGRPAQTSAGAALAARAPTLTLPIQGKGTVVGSAQVGDDAHV